MGLAWADYVERWVADCGGWLPLADRLIHRAGDAVDIPLDPGTVERGLRRLSRRAHRPGGQYGRWMLRFLGFTTPVEQWVKWMGIYHTRFADLPAGLRLEHLALWNRPPISESPLACWIDVGIASVHFSRLDLAACDHWLSRAERHLAAIDHEAEIEVGLVRAQLETETGAHDAAARRLAAIETCLEHAALPINFTASYRARIQHQRAIHCTRPLAGEPDLARARALYEVIPDSQVPFVAFRKQVGLAYCAWKLGDTSLAIQLAERAVDAAGDGGLIRMRVMALNMLGRLVAPDRAHAINERARLMANALQDEDLLRRVEAAAPS